MGKPRMIGQNKPFIPNAKADPKRKNPFAGKKSGLVVMDEYTRFNKKAWAAAKKITERKDN